MKKIIGLLISISFFFPPVAVRAQWEQNEPAMQSYTYEEALSMALKDLSGLLTLDENLKLMKEQLDDLKKQQRELQRIPELTPLERMILQMDPEPKPTAREQLRNAISNLERQMESLELNRVLIQAGTELSLRNILVTLANLEMDKTLIESTLALNEENLRRVTVRREFGLASDNDLRAAEQVLEQTKMNIGAMLITQTNETQNLSKLLQLPLEDEVMVEWERDLIGFPEDLTVFIQNQTAGAPTIKQKELNYTTKKASRDLYKNDDDRKLALQSEYNQALRELNDAKHSLEAVIRTSNQNAEQLRQRDEALRMDLEKATNQKETVRAHLNAGLVTLYELEQAALAILNAETAIEKNMNQLWLLQFSFMHPYLMG
jgi:hypothetical protein